MMFSDEYMIINQFSGGYSMTQKSTYTANGNSITYRQVEATDNSGKKVSVAGYDSTHTIPCSLSDGVMKFGTATWSAF